MINNESFSSYIKTDNKFEEIENKIYVSSSLFIDSGINKGTLQNKLSLYRCNKSKTFENIDSRNSKEKLIEFNSIPTKYKALLGLPNSYDELKFLIKKNKAFLKDREKFVNLKSIRLILSNAWSNDLFWVKYKAYYRDYCFDNDIHNRFAKTHSLFVEIFQLKKEYKLTHIFEVYMVFKNAVFYSKNYKVFHMKIIKAEKEGIDEVLVHQFRRLGREPYKLKPMIRRRIKFYYSNPLQYSITEITRLVNEELIKRRCQTISYSLVRRYINTTEVQNLCNSSRFGKKNAKAKILPFITRVEPRHIGEVLEIDCTEINFLIDNSQGFQYKIWLCAVIDVYSRKIIGCSFDRSENSKMILECLAKAFEKLKVIPVQIVHDGHSAYQSTHYKDFRDKLSEYGVVDRTCKPYNPEDKAHIERWFRTLKDCYLKKEPGYLGGTIQSKGQKGRINKELEDLFSSAPYKKGEQEIINLIKFHIETYNNSTNTAGRTPGIIFLKEFPNDKLQFTKPDLSYLFFNVTYATIYKSKILIRLHGKKFYYTLYNKYLVNKLNGTKVIVRYDASDLTKIDVFHLDTNQYITTLEIDAGINMVINEDDKKKLKEHHKKIQERIYQNIDDLKTSIEQGYEEINSIPVISLEENYKEYEDKKEDTLKDILYRSYPFDIDKRKKNDLLSSQNKFYLKSNKKKNYKEIK